MKTAILYATTFAEDAASFGDYVRIPTSALTGKKCGDIFVRVQLSDEDPLLALDEAKMREGETVLNSMRIG